MTSSDNIHSQSSFPDNLQQYQDRLPFSTSRVRSVSSSIIQTPSNPLPSYPIKNPMSVQPIHKHNRKENEFDQPQMPIQFHQQMYSIPSQRQVYIYNLKRKNKLRNSYFI